MVLTDTQALGGINSIVKHMVRVAPNMRLKLLSSRTVIKKTVADRIKDKAAREELLRFAVEQHAQGALVAADRDRFAVVATTAESESSL
eukprot:5218195-Alexandrium_andersonii.AAC.1